LTEREKTADDLIKSIAARINKKPERTKGWGKAIKIFFTDTKTAYWTKLSMEGTVEEMEKGSLDQLQDKVAVATLEMTTETLQGILNGSISPVETFLRGKVKVQGSIDALLKLASAFGVG
jgi:putative sterol carrier protein